MAGSISVKGTTAHAPAPKVPALKPGYYAAPKGVAPGWVIRYENGVPVGMEKINNSGQPGMDNSNVGIAPGYMLVVGADGKPQMVKGDAAGASKAAPAAAPGQPDDAAAKKMVDPFLTADDLRLDSEFVTGAQTQNQGLESALTDLTANTGFSLQQNEQNAKAGFSNTNDDAAARGIFQSSIRDGGLADIEAKRATTADQLTSALTRAQIDTNAQKTILWNAIQSHQKWKNDKAIENAAAINSQIQPTTDPSAGQAPTTKPVSSAPSVPVPAAVNKPAVKAPQTPPTGGTSPIVTGQAPQHSTYSNVDTAKPKVVKPKAPTKPKTFNSSR